LKKSPWNDDQSLEEICFYMVLVPFVVAFMIFGCSLAVISGRFLVDLAINGGRLCSSSASTNER
jgi:hypothetical protein